MQGNNTIITQEQMMAYANLPGFASLSEEEKREKVKEMITAVLHKVFIRISPVLTDEDMKKIDEIDAADTADGTALRYFLTSKVPNFEAIVKEEVETYAASIKN